MEPLIAALHNWQPWVQDAVIGALMNFDDKRAMDTSKQSTIILVVEDERDIRENIAFSLRYGGFEVEEAANGVEAVEKARKLHPALILMDVRMPKKTGYEACQELKALDETKDIPVVFLSAKGQEAEIKQGMELGAVDYILKPCETEQLSKRIAEILQGTRLGTY